MRVRARVENVGKSSGPGPERT